MNKLYTLLLSLIILANCSSNNINDFSGLKQKALEIPPDFALTPPGKGEIANENAAQNETEIVSDIETLILDSTGQAENNKVKEETDNSGSLEKFIEEQFDQLEVETTD